MCIFAPTEHPVKVITELLYHVSISQIQVTHYSPGAGHTKSNRYAYVFHYIFSTNVIYCYYVKSPGI